MRSPAHLMLFLGLAACAETTTDSTVLTGDALSARLSGQVLRLSPPEGVARPDLILIARLSSDGVSEMSAEQDGAPVEAFEDTKTWTVRGQALCIYDRPAPDRKDCIRVDWIRGNEIQMTDFGKNGSTEVAQGTLSPM